MGGLISVNADGVQLVDDHLGRNGLQGVVTEKLHEAGHGRTRECQLLIDDGDQSFGEGAQLHQGAFGVAMGIVLGEPAQRRQLRPAWSQVFEIL